MLHIIYHPQYLNYRFGPGHPFWPERAEVFLKLIKKGNLDYKLHEPKKALDQDILLAHAPQYLERVKRLAKTRGALSIDTPVNEEVLEAAYYHTGGTILATKLALEGKRVMNLLGGLHHAGIADSSGFCIFNDHAIAIKKLQKQKRIKKAFVFDVDVHAGQGTQEIFYGDPSVFTFSIHQDPKTLYPGTGFPEQRGEGKGKGFNRNIILEPGSGEEKFLKAVDQGLSLHRKFNPDLTILVFGADTYKKDPLANIRLELETYEKLGKKVRQIKKLAVLCAGGYSRKVPEIWLKFLNGLFK
jgi:acetoin utilization protein AcuC